MLTGFGSLETAQESIRTGVQGYLTKPVDCDRLYSVVEESIRCKAKERVDSARCHKLEEELKLDKQKLDSMKDELTTLITHELRTPVAVISESFSLLKDATAGVPSDGIEAFSEKEKKRLFEFLERGHRRLVTVIEDISYFIDLKNRVASVRKSEVILNDFLEGCFAAFERLLSDTRATLKKRFYAPRLSVLIDKEKFLDCLARIIYNAAHNNPDGVEIALKLSCVDKTEEGGKALSYARVEICDDGKGIEEEKLKHLFDPFTVGNIHQHDKGIGLGLAICKEVIGLHDGNIRVENKQGGGLAVAIEIPLAKEQS
jgi:signal transduction histidine kinase